MNTLHPSVRTVWALGYAAWALPAILVAGFYELVHLLGDDRGPWPTGLLTLALVALAVVAVLVLPRLRYRHWRYELRPDELYLERGVVTRVRTYVPLARIQHLDLSQNLVERELDLARLVVHTAGIHIGAVVLPGLRLGEAEALRDLLKRYILEDAA